MDYYVAAAVEAGLLVGLVLIAWGYRRQRDEARAEADFKGKQWLAALEIADEERKARWTDAGLAATAREEELAKQTVGEEWTPGARGRCTNCLNLYRLHELADGLCDYCRNHTKTTYSSGPPPPETLLVNVVEGGQPPCP